VKLSTRSLDMEFLVVVTEMKEGLGRLMITIK